MPCIACKDSVVTRNDESNGRRAWLTPTLVVLTVISFMQDAASELLYPLLPVFLTGVLAAPPVVLGVVEGVADATAGVVRYFAGRWSDKYGRKRFIGAGYGMAAMGKAIVAGAVGWPMVLAGRVTDRFGKGLRSAPRDALIAASTDKRNLGRAFGFHRMGDSLGAVVGPLLGLLALSALDDDVRAAMWWAIVPACISALLTLLIRDVHPMKRVVVSSPAPAHGRQGTLPQSFKKVVTVLVIIALVNFSDALLLLRVHDLGFSTTELILAYVVFNSVYTIASYPAGVLSDRWPKHVVYSVGLACFSVGYLGLGLVGHSGWVFIIVGVYGLFPAFTDGVGKAWIASLVDPSMSGHAQGVFQGLNNGAILVAGLWAGLLWKVGPGQGVVPLVASGTIGGVAAVLLATGAIGDVRRAAAINVVDDTRTPTNDEY